MDLESLKRRISSSAHGMQHALNELKTYETLALKDCLELLDVLLKQKLFKSDEDVLSDALDLIQRVLDEHKSEQLWAKLAD